ncbi:MAG: TatD family hydrolase [Alphaproteobacteria bacterium]
MFLVDSHCHLDHVRFAEDRDETIQRARDAGIGHMTTISTHVSRFDQVAAVAEAHPDITCTVGVHPHHADEEGDVTVERLVELSAHPKCIGIGESGLDYFYEKSTPDNQARSFRTHIRASLETGLPLVIHARDADADIESILREETAGAGGRITGILHCFSSGRGLAEAGLELGLHISLSGIVTFPASQDLRDIVKDVPHDRLLVETDSPYLAPPPHRGKRCEPAFVAETASTVSDIIGVTPAELAELTTDNFARLFPKAGLKDA